jgi:hypothetical protein
MIKYLCFNLKYITFAKHFKQVIKMEKIVNALIGGSSIILSNELDLIMIDTYIVKIIEKVLATIVLLGGIAWALIGLLAVGKVTGNYQREVIEKCVNYLLVTQKENGTWDEDYFTGTGFPCHFYLKYHFYQQYFPLLALGRYRALI